MSAIHLIDSPNLLTLAMVRSLQPATHRERVWVIGTAEVVAAARQVGVHVDRHLPAGTVPAAWASLWRAMRQERATPVLAWSPRIAALAAIAGWRQVVAAVTEPIRTRSVSNLLKRRAAGIITFNPVHRDRLIDEGFAAARLHNAAPVAGALPQSDRDVLRRKLGVGDEAVRIVLAVGGDPRRMDGMLAMLAVGLAAETARPLRLLISPENQGAERAVRTARASGRGDLLIVDGMADEPWHAARAADLGLALTDGPGLTWAMWAGLPIVGQDTAMMRHRLQHGETALLERSDSPGRLARSLCRLHDDPTRARQLGEAAAAAAEAFNPVAFRSLMARVLTAQSMGETSVDATAAVSQ